MADIRSSQNVAQIEWQEPGVVKSFQVLVQVEYVVAPVGWTGTINGVSSANIAKINGIPIANIAKINGI